MYFSIAVILIYGISIAMLVAASTLRRSHSDYELKSFMRSYSRLDFERRCREKQRVRAVLQRLDLTASPATLVAVASTAPDAAVALRLPAPAGSSTVLPARSPARLDDTRSRTVSTWWHDRSPPTVRVVDFSASERHGDDDSRAIPDSNVLLHHHHHHQQQQQQQH